MKAYKKENSFFHDFLTLHIPWTKKFYSISGFSFWAIQPNWKDGNNGKFIGSLITVGSKWLGCYFHVLKLIPSTKNSEKSNLDRDFFSRKQWRSGMITIELNWIGLNLITLLHVDEKIHTVSLDHITKYMFN